MLLKIILVYILFSISNSLSAQWSTTPDSALLVVGNGICPMLAVDPNDESVFVVYLIDERIEARKFDRYGYPMWGGNAVALLDTPSTYWVWNFSFLDGQWGQVISDDSGGVIVCWEDYRHAPLHPFTHDPEGSEIYIQRVDVNGQVRYGTNGKKISGPATDGFRWIGDMKTDYHVGFVISYNYTFSPYYGFLKKYNIKGNEIWERMFTYGFNIDVNVTDIAGNIFVSYGGSHGQPNRRMKLDLQGNYLWPDTLDGQIPDSKLFRWGGAFSDGMGGAIGVGDGYLKVNRVDSTGQFVFGNNGINLGGGQLYRIGNASDNNGGLLLSWSKNNRIIVQRVAKNGTVVFDSTGLIIYDDPDCSGTLGIVSDKKGGGITAWNDFRNNPKRSYYAQRIDSIGNILWDSSGIELHTTTNDPFLAGVAKPFYSDGSGGAILISVESGQGGGIMLKQISRDGIIGYKPNLLENKEKNNTNSFQLFQNYPNPFNLVTTIKFDLPKRSHIKLVIHNILGQEVKTLLNETKDSSRFEVKWNGTNNANSTVASGLYIYRIITNEFIKSKKMLLLR